MKISMMGSEIIKQMCDLVNVDISENHIVGITIKAVVHEPVEVIISHIPESEKFQHKDIETLKNIIHSSSKEEPIAKPIADILADSELDEYGSRFGVNRKHGETDLDFRKRIKKEENTYLRGNL